MELSPEATEAAEDAELAVVVLVVAGAKAKTSQGVPDTPLSPQRPVVNAITFTVTKLGTAWLPSPAHGSTRLQHAPEGQTSLARKKIRLITTMCFPALAL